MSGTTRRLFAQVNAASFVSQFALTDDMKKLADIDLGRLQQAHEDSVDMDYDKSWHRCN